MPYNKENHIICPHCKVWFDYDKIRIQRKGEGSVAPGIPVAEHIFYSCPECGMFLNSVFVKTSD